MEHYQPGAQQTSNAMVKYPLNIDLKGLKVLIIDDINDTGKSLVAATEHVLKHQPAMIKTAVLHEKTNTICKADFVAEYLKKWRWIIYQWAVIEDVSSFVLEMKPQSTKEAKEKLRSIYGLIISEKEFREIMRFVKKMMSS